MAIRELKLNYYESDTAAEIHPGLQSPAIVVAIDTGDYYFLYQGQKKKMATDAAAITAGFTSTSNALDVLNTLNLTAITNA